MPCWRILQALQTRSTSSKSGAKTRVLSLSGAEVLNTARSGKMPSGAPPRLTRPMPGANSLASGSAKEAAVYWLRAEEAW